MEIPLRSHRSNASNNGRGIFFDVDTLARLSGPLRLNDACINDCALLLRCLFDGPHSEQCAIISTHALAEHRNTSDNDRIWRVTKVSRFWSKTKWIIPIHRPAVPEHWVLCVVDTASQHIDFFDSLAEVDKWLPDVNVSLLFYPHCSPLMYYNRMLCL